MIKIEIPKNCPSCNSVLSLIKDQLFCLNSLCGAKQSKLVHHFSKTLKIKGLGPSSIEKLSLKEIHEIYELRIDEAEYLLKSSRLATKLMDEIEKSKSAYLNELLPAFGIPLVGKSASEKLCSVISNIDDITIERCKEAGLGPKVTENLISWLEEELPLIREKLPFSFQSRERNIQSTSKGVICISGRLSSYKTKADAQKALEEAGYTVKSSVTKDTTHLINESGIESSKTEKARQSGITIITNINELIG